MKTCKIPQCELKHHGFGYCKAHYSRVKRHGDPHFVTMVVGENRKDDSLYYRYYGILARVRYRGHIGYKNYGGRGIGICKEWLPPYGYKRFKEYVLSLPNAEVEGYTIDRIDNDGDYEPSNIRWATRHQQASNNRHAKGVVGVNWKKRDNRWQATLVVNGKLVLGKYFEKYSDAVNARRKAEAEYGIH